MQLPDPYFMGFRLVDVTPPCEFGKPYVCSMSDHVNSLPEDWVERWDWNDMGCYNTEEIALNTVSIEDRDRFTLFACWLYPMLFLKNEVSDIDVSRSVKEEDQKALSEVDLSTYQKIGYDVANPPANLQGGLLAFGCSPLSCNGCAWEFPVNDYYLLDALSSAIEVATAFAREEPEPGPFCVYEVWKKAVSV